MEVNSPQPTLLCFIKLCDFLYRLYDQDVPFLDFVVISVVVVVTSTQEGLGRDIGRMRRLSK